ncbi:aminoacyl-tRNA hydrolase [Mahella australiensis]|uniref:Peptidyl-tRNA hydrolase n=1 Tax=Mahella australiensis (strain DSM 15567 / CIP 107919 / 50-1 BON) TaxID=697281 RepID=F4A1G0_MAHA5|nr:aminoacyl-tRNA hydrolase [Mahella australiensis]AEE95994.1 peptidyl-tRNA hydrolase [Mahella australiensis 50-1 BON]
MYIIVGLGNPGDRYKYTRHNVGFMVIDILAQRNGIKLNKLDYKALWGEAWIGAEKVILAKPQTFMNASGESVYDIVRYFKPPLEHLIVIYDDIDLPLGRIRIRTKGSAGTHNGMRSIIYMLDSDAFPRIRVGIDRPGPGMDLVNYVLSGFDEQEQPIIYKAMERAADAAEAIVKDGIEIAMSKYNGDV